MDSLNSMVIWLLAFLFDAYILLVMLRVVLQWEGVRLSNQLMQRLLKYTRPVMLPFQRIMPVWRGIDFPSITALLLLEVIKLLLVIWLQADVFANFGGLLILAFASLLSQLADIFFYALMILAILSWLRISVHYAFAEIIVSLTEPLLRPIRRILPPLLGLDLSPLPLLILLKLLTVYLISPLADIGFNIALNGVLS